MERLISVHALSEPMLSAPGLVDCLQIPSKEKESCKVVEKFTRATTMGLEKMRRTPTRLVSDRMGYGDVLRGRTSISNIGLDLIASAAARDTRIYFEDPQRHVETTLERLKKLKRTNRGFFHTWYDTNNGDPVLAQGRNKFPEVATLDTAWLLAGMEVAANAFPEYADEFDRLIASVPFCELYDEEEQLFHGELDSKNGKSAYYLDMLGSESRVAYYVAIGMYGITGDSLRRLGRSQPATRGPNNIAPYPDPHSPVALWDGTALEVLAPSLLIPEVRISQNGLGNAIQTYCAEMPQNGWYYPCEAPDGTYQVYADGGLRTGVLSRPSIQSPVAAALALEHIPAEATEFLRGVTQIPDAYDPVRGFKSSVDVDVKNASDARLAPDQAMTVVGLSRHLLKGRFDYFERRVGKKLLPLLAQYT